MAAKNRPCNAKVQFIFRTQTVVMDSQAILLCCFSQINAGNGNFAPVPVSLVPSYNQRDINEQAFKCFYSIDVPLIII